jgi:glycosyltransferase involved in cell wall biosynthesis
MPDGETITVLHYVGYDEDRGGILTFVRALAAENQFRCVLGVNPDFRAGRSAALERVTFPPLAGDTISLANAWRARRVAREVRTWLHADPTRVFHAHSRAGLLVALWLRAPGERRVLATVHCYGRQKWFYRWAARRLGDRILWLHPAMKRYYGVAGVRSDDCMPSCIASSAWRESPRSSPKNNDVVRFGCVGAIAPVKQWELVLHALARAPASPAIAVTHAGSADTSAESARYAAELRRLAAGPDIGARWEWRGEVADIARFFAEIDCLIVASGREAFSLAVLEAAAAGVPVLASSDAGIRDLVEAARLGWIFNAGSATALATRMTELAAGGALRTWQRHDAALRPFTAPVIARRHAEIYRQRLHA